METVMKKGFLLTILFAGFSLASLNCLADIHIKQTQNIAGRSLTSEVFIKGKRKRSETDQGTGKSISITQCDLKRTITLNEGTHKYLITSMDATGAAAGSNIDVSTGSEPSRK